MKKLIYGSLFLALVGIGFVGCKKEINEKLNSETAENSKLFSEKLFLENLIVKLEEFDRNSDLTKSINPSYPSNPYDAVGIEHNVQLAAVHNHPNYSRNRTVIANIYNANYIIKNGVPVITNAPLAIGTINTFIANATLNGAVNYNWIASLNVPTLEKQTLDLYFRTVYSTSVISQRLSLSKLIEDDVKNSTLFNADSKKRVLTCFSIYRHSTVYWTDYNNPNHSPISDYVDAMITEMCMDGSIGVEGFDVSCSGVAAQIGAFASAMVW